ASSFNADISSWDVSNVVNMNGMFSSASSFNQDLSLWCVSNIPSEPGVFSRNSPLSPENTPVWGTCPGRPAPIVLTSPDNNASVQSQTPTFEWLADDDATVYQLQVFEGASITVIDSLTSELTVTVADELKGNTTHFWRVRGINTDVNRTGEWSAIWQFTTELATSIDGNNELPNEISLSQNYPNPFNPSTIIEFTLPAATQVRLEIFNMIGQRVALLANEQRSAGVHTINFDASGLSSGMYLIRLNADTQMFTRKMTLIK
ncbi:MAG: BspA family leucine-rich repeat surface protein, partial [Balneolaceae bacterium]